MEANLRAHIDGLDVPDDAMVTALIRVSSYIDAEGEARISWQFDGEQSVSQTVGDLERVQLNFLMQMDEFTDG